MEQEFGNGWTEGVHPDDFDLCLKTYVESFDKREAFLMEYRMKNKSGEYRWIRDFGRPFYDLDNSFLGYIGSCYDITEIKDNEMKLIELNVTKDKFFSLIAHDLRGPFNALLGFTKLLEYELPTMTQDRIQKVAVTMRKSATNLYNLLENLLAWSQMERGVNTIIPESFSVMTKIIESMATIQELAIKKGINVKYEINNDLVVFTDSNMFATIIRNLTSNAIKFTPKGGNITIGAKPVADNWVEISITDTGIGMDQEMQENLFKLEVNTSRKGTEKEESTGLGLIICKGYIEKQGGRMWFESKEGQGSTFYFSLPGKNQNA
jgi:signal transduction histidine kinase